MSLLELFRDDPNYFEVKSGGALYREDEPACIDRRQSGYQY